MYECKLQLFDDLMLFTSVFRATIEKWIFSNAVFGRNTCAGLIFVSAFFMFVCLSVPRGTGNKKKISHTHFFFIRTFFIRNVEADIWPKI